MASSARIDEIKKKFDENPRRYFAPLANEFRKAGDLDQAILICEEFLPQQAGHMSGHIVYGQALYEAGRLPESRTVFETALGLDPENLIALRHLGDIARSQGDLTEARRWYDRVLEADPRNEEIQGLIASLESGDASSGATTMDGGALPPGMPAIPAAEAPPLVAIDLDLDDSDFAAPAAATNAAPEPMGRPVTPPPLPEPDAPFESLSLDGLEPTNAEAATAASMPETSHARAEGFESSEFEAPQEALHRAEGLEPAEFETPATPTPRAEGLETTALGVATPEPTDDTLLDLESSFELGAGSTASRDAVVPPVAGLEESGAAHPPAVDEPALPSLDLDEGLAVPPHGDRLAGAEQASSVPDVPLGMAAGANAENPRMEPPAAMEAMPALTNGDAAASEFELASFGASTTDAAPPVMELPPSVIAAESELMDLDEMPVVGEGSASVTPRSNAPFVTETMAELYLKQGFREQALGVYRQLSAAAPGDHRLRERVSELEREQPAAAAPAESGPNVREFFFRMATRQPGEQSAHVSPPSNDDFAEFEPIPETPHAHSPEPEPYREPLPEPEPVNPSRPTPSASMGAIPSAAERATTAQGGPPASGTIDALFGNRAASTSEDSAASALAQAFGGTAEAPAITGRPARAATAELSLDSVFRDGPPRPPRISQSFSFDQFFSEGAASEPGTGNPTPAGGSAVQGEPAERTADDVQQFNSWLQGLKQQ